MCSGFTLLEIMISIVIFSIFSTAVISSLQSSSNLSEVVTAKSDMSASCLRIISNLADDISSSQIIDIAEDHSSVTYRRVTSVNPIVYGFVQNVSYDNLKTMYNLTETFEGSLNGINIPSGITATDLKGFFIIRNGTNAIMGVSMKYDRTSPIVVSFTSEVIIRSLVNKVEMP